MSVKLNTSNAYKADKEKIIMANYININKTARIEAQGTRVNGNTKGVVCVTDPAFFTSITDAAETAEVHVSVMSNHVRELSKTCKGNVYMKADDPRVIPALANTATKAKAEATKEAERADKAEAKLRELDAELAEYRQWKAEQEAARKAEEVRRKKIASANDKLAKLEAERERRQARLDRCNDNIVRIKMELELLNRNGKEAM